MTTVNVSFTTQKLSVPATVQPSSAYNLRLMQGTSVKAVVNVALPAVSGSFANVAAGTYTASVQRTSTTGAVLGEASSAPFTVDPPPMDIDVPAVVNVTIG